MQGNFSELSTHECSLKTKLCDRITKRNQDSFSQYPHSNASQPTFNDHNSILNINSFWTSKFSFRQPRTTNELSLNQGLPCQTFADQGKIQYNMSAKTYHNLSYQIQTMDPLCYFKCSKHKTQYIPPATNMYKIA